VQLQCAECHDHPFTPSWKQNDFWGLAAFYGGLRVDHPQQGASVWGETPTVAAQEVSMTIPPTALKNVGRVVPARLLGDKHDYRPTDAELLRTTLAKWMTSPENSLFAEAAANRSWAHFFGRGLVNPVDDLRADNPPTHPAVLALLAEEFKKSQFDLRHLVRCVCLSRTYQRSSVPTSNDDAVDPTYAHRAIKVLSPGVFYDSLTQAAGLGALKIGLPERKTILTTITDVTPRDTFIDFFRAAVGEEADPLEYTYGMPQKLKLLNAMQLNQGLPTATDLTARGLSREQTIEQLYLTAFARHPTSEESRRLNEFLDKRKGTNLEEAYSAVLWTLLNSSEFVLNH
jgi:hypothetical protein